MINKQQRDLIKSVSHVIFLWRKDTLRIYWVLEHCFAILSSDNSTEVLHILSTYVLTVVIVKQLGYNKTVVIIKQWL